MFTATTIRIRYRMVSSPPKNALLMPFFLNPGKSTDLLFITIALSLRISYKWNHAVCNLSRPAASIQHDASEILLSCGVYREFKFLSRGWQGASSLSCSGFSEISAFSGFPNISAQSGEQWIPFKEMIIFGAFGEFFFFFMGVQL